MKKCISIIVLVALTFAAGAQSPNFKLGKWIEIHNSILGELSKNYVDTIPVDRIERNAVDAMLGSLDPYTIYIPEEENEDLEMLIHKTYGGIGAVIFKPEKSGNVIINEPYAGSAAVKYGLECTDEILEIDGQTVVGLTSQECSEKMRGEPGTKVVFKVKKRYTGEIKDIEVIREKIHLPDVAYAGMITDKVGYISQTGFTEGIGKEVREAVVNLKKQGMDTLVLDLRGNGGGLMNEAVEIVSIFVPKGSVVVSAKGRGDAANYTLRTSKEPVDLKLKVIVLVDSGSASASEIVAGALQDLDRATIMGTRTYGKGLVQSMRPLPYGGELKLTTAKYYTPSGRCVQAIDYSNRKEDGSVGHIPDSLTHEFKTAHGRSVRDGGGITPDVILDEPEYSRISYALVAYNILEQYALEFVRKHETIAPVDEFKMSDEDFEDFVEYAKGQTFDYRSSAKSLFDEMRKEIGKDGLEESVKEELDAVSKALEIEKADFIRLKKDEIVPLIEEEIVIRYYMQEAGVKLRIRYDTELWQALKSPLISLENK